MKLPTPTDWTTKWRLSLNDRAPHRLRQLVNALAGRKVLVVGDVMLDRYLWGRVQRISPEAPVPVVEVTEESSRPGGAANVAANLAALGADARLVGVIGEDADGEMMRSLVHAAGLDASGLLALADRETTVKTRVMAHGAQVVRVDRETRAPVVRGREIVRERVAAVAEDAEAVIISDYGKGMIDRALVEFLIERTASRGWLAVDPKDPTLEKYRGVSLVTPNLGEAGAAFGRPLTDEDLVMEAGRAILHRLGLRALLVTRGEHGLSLFEPGGGFTHFPTASLEVYDVTGAGDTVIATFTASLAAGSSLAEAAVLANHAAGVAVREVGTAAVTADELLLSLED